MKSDAVILGAELDGLVAAARLIEHGHSVRLFSAGAGSLHYSPDGVRVLGFAPVTNEESIAQPLTALNRLAEDHPYQKIGVDQISRALNWYAKTIRAFHQDIVFNDKNEMMISPAGLDIPTCGISKHQATVEKITDQRVTIVVFHGHRDFPADLLVAELTKKGISSSIVYVHAPGEFLENGALAKSFDAVEIPDNYFAVIRNSLPPETEVVLFPAVMGFARNKEIMEAAEQTLGVPCLEVPTLPPSVPGMRLEQAFVRHLQTNGVNIHRGVEVSGSSLDEQNAIILRDNMDRPYETSVVVVSTGGVLMGGLNVDSHGTIHETSLGLDTYQSEPLAANSVDQSLNALHTAGIETDIALRPKRNGSGVLRNVFVTGRSLAHWNPAAESSSEGVCIATGWAAAENAHRYLEALNNG